MRYHIELRRKNAALHTILVTFATFETADNNNNKNNTEKTVTVTVHTLKVLGSGSGPYHGGGAVDMGATPYSP